MPKLWSETIAAHRREVRDAILETTVALVAKHGLAAVTMSQIAEETGIGRATLYKYVPDVESILHTWHERQVNAHVEELTQVRNQAGSAGERLAAVLEAYARMVQESRQHHGTDLGQFLALLHQGEHTLHGEHGYGGEHAQGGVRAQHGTLGHTAEHARRSEHVARARQQLSAFVQDLLAEAAAAGEVRNDIVPDELATYCLHALAAAGSLPSPAAVRRLVAVTLAGLRPPA